MTSPAATIAIATYNAAAYIEAAIASACAQSLAEIEIIVVDDASSDATCDIVARLAAGDVRIRLDRLSANQGPAGARNRAIELARGAWFAVLDADDAIAPGRIETLIRVAQAQAADIVADDMVVFDSDFDGDRVDTARFFLTQSPPDWIALDTYLKASGMFSAKPDFGYLKPIIRLEALRAAGLRYNPALRIAEDDDLIVRLLLAGLRYWLQPDPLYGYRRHGASTSFRLSVANAATIVGASAHLCADFAGHPLAALLARRHVGFVVAHDFARVIAALKAAHFAQAARIALTNPAVLPLLRMPIGALVQRMTGRGAARPPADPDARRALAHILST